MRSRGYAVWRTLVVAAVGALPACSSDTGDDESGGSGGAATSADGPQGSGGALDSSEPNLRARRYDAERDCYWDWEAIAALDGEQMFVGHESASLTLACVISPASDAYVFVTGASVAIVQIDPSSGWKVPAWIAGNSSLDYSAFSPEDQALCSSAMTGWAGGALSAEPTTTCTYAGFESHAWRSSLDYGPDGRPWIVNAAIHGTSATDMFVVGHFGTGAGPDTCYIDRLVGDTWQVVEETDACLYGVWVASPSLVFGVGVSRFLRIDLSQGIAEVVSETSNAGVWGWNENDVIAVGFEGSIVHYDGEDVTPEESGTDAYLKAVWGSDPDNVFVVGDGGTILTRRDGGWIPMESGTSLDLNDVWGSGPSDVYAVGGVDGEPGHVILHYDGSGWSMVHAGDDRVSALLGVAGRSASDVCAVGAYRDAADTAHALVLCFDGSTWRELPLQAEAFLWDVWPAGADAYYVVGPDDTLALVEG